MDILAQSVWEALRIIINFIPKKIKCLDISKRHQRYYTTETHRVACPEISSLMLTISSATINSTKTYIPMRRNQDYEKKLRNGKIHPISFLEAFYPLHDVFICIFVGEFWDTQKIKIFTRRSQKIFFLDAWSK